MFAPIRFAIPFALAIAASLAAALAEATDRREARPVGTFTTLALSAPIKVVVSLGDTDSLELQGDEQALADIETRVERGSLTIRVLRDRRESKRIQAVVAHVGARRIDALSIAGSGDIVAPRLEGASLEVSIAGSGDVTVSGRVDSFEASIAGSGDVRAGKLEARRVKVSIAGSGDTTVWALDSLSVSVTGSGDVRYYGDPAMSRSVLGSARVRRLGAAPS